MSLTVKAYVERPGKETEIRRFPVPADVSSNYEYLSKKISDVFPTLSSGNFILFWKDDENDLVRFSSDDELMSALSFRQGDVFKVFVHVVGEETKSGGDQPNPQVHPNITCDGCEGPVVGNRYKCYVCPDYDLCSTCESAGTHSEHEMLKIPAPKDTWMGFIPPPPHFGRWMRRFMKRWHNQHPQGGAGCSSGAPEDKPCDPEGKAEESKADGANAGTANPENSEDADVASQYLQDVGESVAAMLDPLGIDVAVDVETGGRRSRMRGHRARGGWRHGGPWGPWGPPPPPPPPGSFDGCPWGAGPWGAGPWGFQGCGMKGGRGGSCKRAGAGKGKKQQGPATTETAAAPEKEATPTAPPPQTEAMEEQASSPGNITDFIVEKDPKQAAQAKDSSPDSEWTVVTPSMSVGQALETDGTPGEAPAQPAPQTQPPPSAQPADPKIAKALQQMMEMGFSNEGGWLTRLVEMKQGDISQCLDAIKPLRVVESTGERRA